MFQKIVRAFLLVSLIYLTMPGSANAQAAVTDTVKLTVKQAEDLFIKNNLQLIIQRYNIDNANAAIITAKLFPNPDFSFANGIYATQVKNAASEQSLKRFAAFYNGRQTQ